MWDKNLTNSPFSQQTNSQYNKHTVKYPYINVYLVNSSESRRAQFAVFRMLLSSFMPSFTCAARAGLLADIKPSTKLSSNPSMWKSVWVRAAVVSEWFSRRGIIPRMRSIECFRSRELPRISRKEP